MNLEPEELSAGVSWALELARIPNSVDQRQIISDNQRQIISDDQRRTISDNQRRTISDDQRQIV
jgi:hypothetical protein